MTEQDYSPPAWHALGPSMPVGCRSADEAFDLAELDGWGLHRETMVTSPGRHRIGNRDAVVPDAKLKGLDRVLGVVGGTYVIRPNEDQKRPIMDALTGGRASIDCAGFFNGGRRVFAVVNSGDRYALRGGPVDEYYLRIWGHDGNYAPVWRTLLVHRATGAVLSAELPEPSSGLVTDWGKAQRLQDLTTYSTEMIRALEGLARVRLTKAAAFFGGVLAEMFPAGLGEDSRGARQVGAKSRQRQEAACKHFNGLHGDPATALDAYAALCAYHDRDGEVRPGDKGTETEARARKVLTDFEFKARALQTVERAAAELSKGAAL